MNNDVISVVVPIYNAEKYLKRCIESILNQSYRELEVLLINDGSKDSSLNIIKEYASIDSRIRIVDKENEGVSKTRNRGLNEATGKYIYFIDSDDYIDADTIELLYKSIENNSNQLSVCSFYNTFDNTEEKVEIGIKNENILKRNRYLEYMSTGLYSVYYGALWNKLYCTKIIRENKLYFEENISLAEDFIFNLYYLEHIDNVGIVEGCKYHYYQDNQASLTKTKDVWYLWDMAKIRYQICIEQYKKMECYDSCETNIQTSIGFELIAPTFDAVKEHYCGYGAAKEILKQLYSDKFAKEATLKMKNPTVANRIAKVCIKVRSYGLFVILMRIWVKVQRYGK